jgi:hypothetical protein
MKAPKCRSCGAEEWRHVCAGAVSPAGVSRVTPGVVEKASAPSAKRRVSHVQAVSHTEAVSQSATYRYRDEEARRVYQRDLMRSRRRAARRVAGGAA